jgi:GT2 family glycosyltransferase
VIIVNWNRCTLLRACLESLRRQRNVSFEVILVDNGSTDGSVEMARRDFGEACPLTIVENPDNRGFCEANNQGISLARGKFVALLNNDAEADPDWLHSLCAAFEGRPEMGMAASKIVFHDNPGRIDKAGHLIYLDGQNRGRGTGEIDSGQYDTLEEVIWPDGCAAMYRKEMLDRIGGFDEDFFAYGDDAELGLRARIAGWGCLYVPQAVVRHHHSSTLGALSLRRLELIERNRVLLAAKLFPWSLLWLNGAFYLTRLGAGVWAALTRKGEIARYPGWKSKVQVALSLLRADCQAIVLLPKMLSKRRQVSRIRQLSPSQVRSLLLRFRIPIRRLTEQAM